jgi:hypothetical protein
MSSFFDISFDPGKFVALIPTLMSVVGSVNIVRLVKRSPSIKEGSFTKRILMNMSLCEVVSCIAFSTQSLFIPRETSHILWAIGNGSLLGLMMQFSISSYIFSCFVSFIYLSKVRVDTNNPVNRDFVTKWIEPWTGTLGFGYPIITAMIGAAMQYYSNMELVPTNHDEATMSRQRELSKRIGRFLFPGYPITNLVAAIAVNSFVIFAFVRPNKNKTKDTTSSISQTNGVATAAVLLTYLWTAILRVFESNDILHHFNTTGLYPLLLLQLVLLPALGLYTVVTWLSSRTSRIRSLYPFESYMWCIRRGVFGPTKVTPSCLNYHKNEFDFALQRSCRF